MSDSSREPLNAPTPEAHPDADGRAGTAAPSTDQRASKAVDREVQDLLDDLGAGESSGRGNAGGVQHPDAPDGRSSSEH